MRPGSRRSTPFLRFCGVLAACAAAAACGKKGPPLAPLHLVPAAPGDLSARRVGNDVRLRFVLPAQNANGPGRVDLERVEIYAVTVAPGAPVPPNRELLSKSFVVGQLAVRPAPVEGEPQVEGEQRPAPGDAVTFVETLTEKSMTPIPVPATPARAAAAAPAAAPAPPDPAAAAQAAVAASTAGPVRIYVARGITRSGRPGAASPRVPVPVADAPPVPTLLAAQYTERAIVLDWWPPLADIGGTAPEFNVYRGDAIFDPINPSPLKTPGFEQAVEFGAEQCFRVRTVHRAAAVTVEGEASAPSCVTPRDTFAPAAPAGLALVAAEGAINLRWNANTEADLAGYVVLRGEAPDDTLRPLTPEPIRETSFRDASVTPGTRYVYAIVAVDTATPPNTSPQSAREAETAR